MSPLADRRRFLQITTGSSIALGMDWGFLTALPRVEAAEAKLSRGLASLSGEVEPLVRLMQETLDALAKLDYPNFEVIVLDNNTREEAVWRPVEAHCKTLGPRFRFGPAAMPGPMLDTDLALLVSVLGGDAVHRKLP